MDNRKDFIHIDDLFKQLHHGEEQERSGSWLHMKDLLDKEMPVGTPVAAGRSFRRYFIPLLALLLIGGGTAYFGLRENGTVRGLASGSDTHLSSAPSGDAAAHLSAATGERKAPAGSEQAPTSHKDAAGQEGSAGTATASGIAAPAKESTVSDKAIAARRQSGKQAATTVAARHKTDKKQDKRITRDQPGSGTAAQHTVAMSSAAVASSGKTIVPFKENNSRSQAAAKVIEEEQLIEEIKGRQHKNSTTERNYAAATESGNGSLAPSAGYPDGKNLQQLAMSLNSKKIVKDQNGNLYKEERDTFKRIDLVERMVAGNRSSNSHTSFKTITDTVAITRVEKVRYVPLDPMEIAAFRKLYVAADTRKIVPLTNVRDRVLAREMVNLVPLNHYKVASRKVDPGKFNQLVQNTSRGISNYFDGSRNFYAAILVGGNASFANPGAFGMQLGIAGLYALGERLTLAAEFKYVNHYFSNYTLNDQSVTFENITSQQQGAQWLFSGTQVTSTSAYKVNSFSALELPVTLSYNLGRVSLFGGVNMAYAFPISWKKESSVSSIDVQQAQKANQNPFLNEAFRLDEQKDFASRIGLGYVWGISYDLSRKVSLDARMSQILLDNNKGNTDALSRLFRMPTMQFSFGYYFGRKDKVVYIMDKR